MITNQNSLNLEVYSNVRIMFNFKIFAIHIEPVPRFAKKKCLQYF